MSLVHATDLPGLDQTKFSATLDEMPGTQHVLTVTGEASGDYRVQEVKLVRAHHQSHEKTLVLDVKAKLGPVENPHPEFIKLFPLEYKEDPAKQDYDHVKIVNGPEHFTIDVTDLL